MEAADTTNRLELTEEQRDNNLPISSRENPTHPNIARANMDNVDKVLIIY